MYTIKFQRDAVYFNLNHDYSLCVQARIPDDMISVSIVTIQLVNYCSCLAKPADGKVITQVVRNIFQIAAGCFLVECLQQNLAVFLGGFHLNASDRHSHTPKGTHFSLLPELPFCSCLHLLMLSVIYSTITNKN